VPGLMCIVLMMSTLFMTTLSITKERERGTMENLLAMPVRPLEVMLAKIMPFVAIGYIQVLTILASSALFFQLPMRGSLPLLLVALGFFIAGNLALGITYSTVSANQMQAMQFAQLTLMPSFLLSGFMFRHAGVGAIYRRAVPDHPRHADRAGHAAQGQRPRRHPARAVAARVVRAGGDRHRRVVLPRDAGLKERLVARVERQRNPGGVADRMRPSRISLALNPGFCNGPWFVNPSLPLARILSPGSCFCPGSARGRHLMGFEEDRSTNLR
jgi:ABC-2 type transporter